MTGMQRAMLQKVAAAQDIRFEEAKQLVIKQAGISRFGRAEEIANAIAFIVSPTARWTTGTVLRMDGGEVKSTER
ncbi:7-alpha-hydroxysteroid dehydrogenase [Methylovirgula sp. HY1]|nr:7-alpha-hydroxysteroid dehydrogenase [Methylovirgula sp. HY1]